MSVKKGNAFPICCFELDHVSLSIKTCQLAGQHDEVQKNIVYCISFCPYSSYIMKFDVKTYIAH